MIPLARPAACLFLLAAILTLAGCATGSGGGPKPAESSTAVPLPAGVSLAKHQHLQAVWLADGFAFAGYDTAVVAPPEFRAVERPNEVSERAGALRSLQEALANALRDSGAFATVTTQSADVPAGARAATLQLWVVEYEKGGGGARYFAGVYGAGQPVIKVRGHLVDAAGAPLFVFEARRSGESGSARVFGGFRSDVEIQAEDIRDLGVDLRDFVSQRRGAAGNAGTK
jgi:hypothetical protein